MNKKLALIVISLDECFTKEGFSGGGHKVTKHIIKGLIDSNLFDIDIFCKKSAILELDGINSINILNKKTFVKDLEQEIAKKDYDFILSSDVLLPFGNLILHSNSAKYKSKNGKSGFLGKLTQFYNYKKIKKQEYIFQNNDKNVFTVSESLKKDYSENYNLLKEKVFACIPAVDESEDLLLEKHPVFTIGSMAGGGLNKGGFLLLLALWQIKKAVKSKLHARIIFPKMHKAFLYKSMIKLFGLQDIIELLPKQKDMNSFYKSIDCYILPSLNEAFGLVVTEAASKSRPSLVSSTTGVRELIVDSENGFVFDRENHPVKNLAQGLKKVYAIYFSDFEKYKAISKGAYQLSQSLDWEKFTNRIIANMKEEKHERD